MYCVKCAGKKHLESDRKYKNKVRNWFLSINRKVHFSLKNKAFLGIFYKKINFLWMVYSKHLQKYDTKTIVMEETNRQSLYVCFCYSFWVALQTQIINFTHKGY